MSNVTCTDPWPSVSAPLVADVDVDKDADDGGDQGGEEGKGAKRAEDAEGEEGAEGAEFAEGAGGAGGRGGEAGGTADRNVLPSYLQVLPEWRVVLCTTHGGCYTRQNLSRHLLEKHRLKSTQRRWIEADSRLRAVAATGRGLPRRPVRLPHSQS
ncbi:hypothetical protein VTO42DRAFT_5290 [Malbranchea cinnamomea]